MRRRAFMAGITASAALAGTGAVRAQSGAGARTFVLVHGAWHGGWCWVRVADRLRAAGHRVFTPTLSGLGERAHLPLASITLDTHGSDIANVILCEELDQVVLVGHSYGGIVITKAMERIGAQVTHLVYLDAVVLADGESWSSHHTPEQRAQRAQWMAQFNGGWPVPKAAGFGVLDARDQMWVDRRLTPQPGGPYRGTVRLTDRWRALPKTFIDCTQPALTAISPFRRAVRKDPAWRVWEIATGHDAMVSAPAELAAMLARI